MDAKTVYQTNAAGVYEGVTIARESPLEPGVYLIPAGAVTVEPPAVPEGHVAVWDEAGAWSLVEDHRGRTIYATATAEAQIVAALGSIPAGYTDQAPPAHPVWDGTSWQVDLPAARVAACARIDAQAETLRNTVLTPGSGQMAAYQAKEAQATAYLQDADPTEAEYPDLYNETGITADTVHEVAMAVLAAAETWRTFGRDIERVRLAAKKAIREAGNLVDIAAAEAAVEWPTTYIG